MTKGSCEIACQLVASSQPPAPASKLSQVAGIVPQLLKRLTCQTAARQQCASLEQPTDGGLGVRILAHADPQDIPVDVLAAVVHWQVQVVMRVNA
eukprot:CAMPEP_0168490520 /NCGR_PEP_ID=MMETSP0228-20121227/69228_1 /TAXON_ID=133427 /ORGANISM="Protoceratium reticulatum, Strain CCCM 535 (=CCMP 1889)" /LENGTH=94 /DNA_ID=CAMNT_0008507239 /DNA_START=355 /DNA_END=636 /DNA_ORIENTATION=+